MRYIYLKSGEAVDEVRRIRAGNVDRSGPDAFICDFVLAHAADELFILARWKTRETVLWGNVRAESYPLVGQRMSRAFARAWAALRMGYQMFRWRPERMVCASSTELLWVSVLVAKLRGVPIVNSRHEWLQERKGLGGFASALNRASVRACDAIVCHGPFLTDQIRALGVPASRIHGFEVDLREFAAARTKTEVPESLLEFSRRFDAVVMYVGRVQRDKGVFDLLEAFCGLAAQPSNRIGLVYVGDGADMAPLRAAVIERGVADSVLFLGSVPHARLPAIMSLATVIATPTRPELPEGRCLVVLEAFVLGVPVVAPNFAAFPYAIRHDVNGLLFEPGNPNDLRNCLASMLQSRERLERLRQGAAQSGQELVATQTSFSSAVETAFATAAEVS